MDGETYERWVAGFDVETGEPKGRLRSDDQAVRFVEVTVNGPKTWSLAAALHPEIATAYDIAQMAAAEEIIWWLAEHATTRVGPRGRQVQVPVEQIEAAVVRHFTSRAGDPHRHLHLQINARVFAEGKWRGLYTVGVRDSLEAINGIGHTAVMTNPEFRASLASHGLTLDAATGEVVELAQYAGAFSQDAADRDQHRHLRGRVALGASWRGARAGVAAGVGSPCMGGRPPRQGRADLGRGAAAAVGRGVARAGVSTRRLRRRLNHRTQGGRPGPQRFGRGRARPAGRKSLRVERRRRPWRGRFPSPSRPSRRPRMCAP